nr:MAG TPA: Lower collar protein [Caudoviricetes sp.]
MSNYTIELRKIKESLIDDALSNYSIFSEEYRKTLNTKIKQHFWYNEIAHESVDQFLFQLRVKMNEIMPYYNQMYEAELIKRDPYLTMRVRSTNRSSGNARSTTSSMEHGTSSSSTDAKSRAVQSDTPQVMLSGNGDYATGAADSTSLTGVKSESDGTGSQTSTSSSDGTGESSQEGFSGSMASLIQAHRDAIVNVDMMVIAQLEPLFMYVWTPPTDLIGDNYYAY